MQPTSYARFDQEFEEEFTPSPNRPPPSSTPEVDRKFNLVISGIKECEHGVAKLTRQTNDLAAASEILSSCVASVTADSIRDIQRLGKYSASLDHSRPILANRSYSELLMM